jgi:transposase-like protein
MATRKKQTSEAAVREIRRKTRRRFAPEEKIRIVLDGLRGEQSISELCRRAGIASNLYYRWSKDFLEGGKKQLAERRASNYTFLEGPMSSEIDLEFRPTTYFRPQSLAKHLVSIVKNAVLKQKLQVLFDEGRHADVKELLGSDGISAEDTKSLEAIHPMFMGGNYLPDSEDGEVEIARISLSSTTFDVACINACLREGTIHYRIIDEYDGDTLVGDTDFESEQPLTLGKLTDIFMAAWTLTDVLEMNFEDDLDASLDFFSASSDFYQDFDRLCRRRVTEHFDR